MTKITNDIMKEKGVMKMSQSRWATSEELKSKLQNLGESL